MAKQSVYNISWLKITLLDYGEPENCNFFLWDLAFSGMVFQYFKMEFI